MALSQLISSDRIFSLLKWWQIAAAPRSTRTLQPQVHLCPGSTHSFHNPATERLMPDNAGTTEPSTIYSADLSPGWTAGEIYCIHPAQPRGTRFALFPPSMLAPPLLCLFRYLSFFKTQCRKLHLCIKQLFIKSLKWT